MANDAVALERLAGRRIQSLAMYFTLVTPALHLEKLREKKLWTLPFALASVVQSR